MSVTHRYLTATFLVLAAVLTIGCNDSNGPTTPVAAPSPPAQPTGVIEITVTTTNESIDVDPDGYTVRVDDAGAVRAVGVNATVRISGLSMGAHLVRLNGLAVNCSVNGANPRSVDVTTNQAASPVSFSVSCIETSGKGDWDY